jgi:hypothetical protein
MCWHHINIYGEYDFTRVVANDSHFDLDKIMALKLA